MMVVMASATVVMASAVTVFDGVIARAFHVAHAATKGSGNVHGFFLTDTCYVSVCVQNGLRTVMTVALLLFSCYFLSRYHFCNIFLVSFDMI